MYKFTVCKFTKYKYSEHKHCASSLYTGLLCAQLLFQSLSVLKFHSKFNLTECEWCQLVYLR